MSSHHIVRDDQEPALLIANGEACQRELLDQLLEWSPFVVVLDSAIDRVSTLGIKIDVLLGDFDCNRKAEYQSKYQFPIEVIHTPDQDKTDLEKGIEFLINRGFNAANIVWATGKRADHSITNMTQIVHYKDQIKLKILDDYSVIYPCPNPFVKWYPQGRIISLIPVGTVEKVNSKNLEYPLENLDLILGHKTGSSNRVAQDGLVEIHYQSGDLLLMECHD